MPLPSSAVTNQHSKNNNFHIILSRKHLFIFTFFRIIKTHIFHTFRAILPCYFHIFHTI